MWQLSPSNASVPSMLDVHRETVSRSAPDFSSTPFTLHSPTCLSVNGPEYSTLPPVTV